MSHMSFGLERHLLLSNPARRSCVAGIGLAAAVGVLYFFAARLSLLFISRPDGITVFWPAAGLTSGILISLGPMARLPVIAGVIGATLPVNLLIGRDLWSTLVFALCNAGEPVLIAFLIQRFFGSPFRLESLSRVFGFLAAALVATALSGIGATIGNKLFYNSDGPTLTIWGHWLAADGIGIITVAPLIIGLFAAVRDRPPWRGGVEGLLVVGCVFSLAALSMNLPSQAWAAEIVVALFFPLSLWLAARHQPVFAAAGVVIFATAVFYTTTSGIGAFGNPELPVRERVITAQAIILAFALGTLVFAALFAERRRHAAIIVDNEMRLQSALRAGGVMAFDWGLEDGNARRSENVVEILGTEPEEPAALFFARVHPDDRKLVEAGVDNLTTKNASRVVTFRYLRPDGREIWLEGTSRGEFDRAGRLVRLRGLTRDVTERKRAEAELIASRNAADLAERAKSGFLAAASHDLRQPLQSLKLLGHALQSQVPNARGRLLLDRIDRSLDVMGDVLDTLLDVNRLETGALKPSKSRVPVADLFASLETDFLPLVGERQLEWRLVQSRLVVQSDRRMLELMLRNILSNALRYTQRGKILLGCRRMGGKVRIEVRDSGIGIPEEHLPRIFNENYQVQDHAQLGSAGLGLAIVQRLANLLGHRLDVQSIPGKGSCFAIDVPLAPEVGLADDSDRLPATDAQAFRGTVLVIEDDALLRSVFGMVLSSGGLTVVSAGTAHEALEQIATNQVVPDLVLSDFNLPGRVNGIACVEAVRKAVGRNIPAVMLTADVRSEVLDAIAAHDVRIAIKPLNADQLLRLVTEPHESASRSAG